MNNILNINTRIKNILINLKNELVAMQVLLIELEHNDCKNFGPKTLEKISNNIGYKVFYHKDKIDVCTKFQLLYKKIDDYGYNINEWIEFNIFNYKELKEKLKKHIEYKIKYIEFTKNTIKKQKTIVNKINKVIKLKKELGYENYNSEIVDLLLKNNSDSYYFKR